MPHQGTTNITIPKPFLLKATVLATGLHECSPMSWCEGGKCLQLIERLGRDVYRVSVTEASRNATSVTLRLTVDRPHQAQAENGIVRGVMTDRVRRVLGLDHDLTEFYELCRAHPTLRVIPKIGAGRTVRPPSMTECIIKGLCWTNVFWPQAVKMINRLCQLGPALPHFANLHAWPTPREILRAGDKYLTQVCRLGYRTPAILKFCKEVAERRFDPEELDRLAASPDVTSDELLTVLRSIHGIGPSTAHYLLSFLGRHDRLATDSSTVAHVRRTHTKGRKPTHRQIDRIYAPYGRWKNLVWWFEYWLTWDTARQIACDAGQHEP